MQEVHMARPSSPSDPSDYLASLMQAGQFATRQFDDALAAAMGIGGSSDKDAKLPPFANAANMPQPYWSPVLEFWRGYFNGPVSGDASARASRSDRRFKDDAWSQSPFYDLLKKSYLSSSKQL